MNEKQEIRSSGSSPLIDRTIHQQVISTGTDVPEQSPSFSFPLNEVGISGKTVWVLLPEGRLPFTTSITVDLPAHIRGIHMSRLEQAIADLYERPFDRLGDYVKELSRKVIEHQQGSRARVSLSGKRPLLRQSIISGHLSVDPLLVKVEGEIFQDELQITSGIGVCHITACPCTQVYNHDVFSGHDQCPMPTHSQRSQTWLYMRSGEDLPKYDEMLDCLENSLHLTQDLLKRPDEAEIVLKSHKYPQFAEDAVRETAREVGRSFKEKIPADTAVIIESLSLESIHIHDVCCRLETTLGEICGQL